MVTSCVRKILFVELLGGIGIVSDTNYDAIDEVIQSSASRVVTNLWRKPPADERVGDRFLQILLAEGLLLPDSTSP